MAHVYHAKDERLDRDVAIKLIPTSSLSSEQNFAEAKMLAKINHPNVVQIFDVIKLEKHIAIVMEYVDGVSVHQAKQIRFPDVSEKLGWAVQLANGIQAIHRAGLVHSDLKPANILITSGGQLKILDFGIAQFGGDEHCAPASFASRQYASPEQLDARPISYQSDLFSLGILAFELFADFHPFGETDDRVENIQRGKTLDARVIVPALNIELINLLNRLLKHNVKARPSCIDDVVITLSQIQKLRALEEQQETEELVTDTQQQPAKFIPWPLVILFTLVAAVVTYYWFPETPKERFIVVKKPVLAMQPAELGAFKHTLLASVDDALRQAIINQPDVRLLANTLDNVNKSQVQQAAKQAGASLVIWPEISCINSACEVTASVMGQEDDNSPWSVLRQHNWVIQSQTPVSIFNATYDNLHLLMPEITTENNVQTVANSYEQYINIYSRFWFQDDYSVDSLEKLDNLLFENPEFRSAYSLYRLISLNLYDKSGDEEHLNRFEQLMKNAPSGFKSTLAFAVELFMLRKEKGQYELAQTLLELIAQRGGGATLLNELKASLAIATGNYADAVAFYTAAARTRPSISNLYGLAYTYFAIGELAASEQAAFKVASLDKSYLPAINLLANVYLLQERLHLAIEQYHLLIDASPHSFYLSNLSVAYMLDNQFENAQKYAQLAVDKDPENINWLLNLADIKQIQGATEGANALYLKVLQNVRDEDPVSLLIAAQANAHLGNFETAIEQANRGIKLTPDNGETAFNAAIVFTLAGEHLSAIHQIKEALNMDISHIWFTLNWFKSLCQYPSYTELMSLKTHDQSTTYAQAVCGA